MIVFLLAFTLVNCEKEELLTKEMLMELEMEIRIDKFKLSKERRCREEALEIAITQVDSVIFELSRQLRLDTIYKPDRPDRPFPPKVKETQIDSVLQPDFDSITPLEIKIDSI